MPSDTHQAGLAKLVHDLTNEQLLLEQVLADLSADLWDCPTPAPSWLVRHQVAHLSYFDEIARMAIADHDGFARQKAIRDRSPAEYRQINVAAATSSTPGELLSSWRENAAGLQAALRAADLRARAPWFGPSMSVASLASARLMEYWAHGQDIRDGLGVPPSASSRLRHVAHLGYQTRHYAVQLHGLPPLTRPLRLELTAPDGELWTWGEPDSDQTIRGTALDFCLLITRRRHLDDTGLQVSGEEARRWAGVAQCFAGDSGAGRRPGQFGPVPTSGSE
ncbi:TIGR03084 family protein [Micromonospora inositola]|uniref:TIGR03084 family protein n=2 Tax=Micromonospora inositola TaxID=47865 RepID=A0A1C5JN45_9ACTN|nr:TIGR03084 family protein [Micromonospora inositola]